MLRDHEKDILNIKKRRDNVYGLSMKGMMGALGILMVVVSTGYVRLVQPSKAVKEISPIFGLEEPMAGRTVLS